MAASQGAAICSRSIALHGVGTLRAQSRIKALEPCAAQLLRLEQPFSGHPSIYSIQQRASSASLSPFQAAQKSTFLGIPTAHQCPPASPHLSAFKHTKTHSISSRNRPPARASQSFEAPRDGARFSAQPSPQFLQLAQEIAKKVAIAIAVATLTAGVAVLSLPWFLSTPAGLKTSTSLASASIPGTVSVSSINLGWRKPVHITDVKVSDAKGVEVLSVQSIESEADLWSLVTGKSGLGNTTVQGLRVDLARDDTGGEPRALAALSKKPEALKRSALKAPTEVPIPKSADEVPIEVEINVEMPGGSLKFPHAVFNVPWDTAALTGETVQVDIAAGDFAARRDPEAAALASGGVWGEGESGGRKWVPMMAAARSEKFRGAAAGALDVGGGKLHLARPLDANIEINPSTGQLFFARLNPLLAGVVGTKDSGLVQVFASPENMVLPTEEYSFRVEPMTLVLGRGELVSGALELVGQKGPGKTITMRTSAIRAVWNAAGRVEAARTDLRIGDKVHLITWGKMDWAQGSIDMVLAIPSDTLKVALRVPSLSSAYNLQFPLTGSAERPTVDWKAAGKQLAKLVIRQRAPNGWSSLLLTGNDHRSLPEPLDPIPWAQK